jgi:hypothetical protein
MGASIIAILPKALLLKLLRIMNPFPPAWHIEDADTGESDDMHPLQKKLHHLYPDIAPGKGVHKQQ